MQHKQAIVLHREAESAETFAGGVVALTETYKVKGQHYRSGVQLGNPTNAKKRQY